jgi:alkylhydroperoxidase family enzyme
MKFLYSTLRELLIKVILWISDKKVGGAIMPADLFFRHPRLLVGSIAFEQVLWAGRLVDSSLKRLAEVRVASLINCTLCMDTSTAFAKSTGISEEKLRNLPAYKTSPLFSEEERLVLEYADYLTQTPLELPEAFSRKFRRHFTKAQVVEISATIAMENLRSRFYHAVGLESQGFTQGGFCVLPVQPGGGRNRK